MIAPVAEPKRFLTTDPTPGRLMRIARVAALCGKGELERLTGIEPAYQAWEASALPLSYSRSAAARAGQDLA
jgi:hypothetical protein